MNVIILLFLIAFSWFMSGILADEYALRKYQRDQAEAHKNK